METVTISNDLYEDLLRSNYWESALFGAGVDNWDGFEYAQETYLQLCKQNGLAAD